jgi:hypothetical protein
MRILLVVAWSLLTACAEVPPKPVNTPGVPAQEATAAVVRFAADSSAFAQNSGYSEPTTAVIRDSTVWATAWATIHANQQPVPTLPAVDFSREMVVLVGLGSKGSGGWNVTLASVHDSAGTLVIRFVERSPGPGCATTQALTEPVDIARIPRWDGEVRFAGVQVVGTCPP